MTIDMPTIGGAATLPRLINVDEAAELLAVSSSTVRNWIKDETIPYVQLPAAGKRDSYRIPLQGLLNTLSGTYDLAGELERLNEAAKETTGAGMDVRAELRKRRSREPSAGDRPREVVEADPADIF